MRALRVSGAVVIAVCVVILVAFVFALVGLAAGWFSGTAHLVGFQHSSEEVTAVLDDWTNLQAAACNAKGAVTTSQAGDPTMVEDPAFAYKATYRRIEADYNRRMNNFFEAALTRHLPIPAGISSLPRQAPTLSKAEVQSC